jgi:hypothetical protein
MTTVRDQRSIAASPQGVTVGTWFFAGTTTIDGLATAWTETVEVVTAAQNDPFANVIVYPIATVTQPMYVVPTTATYVDNYGARVQFEANAVITLDEATRFSMPGTG